MPDPTRHDLPEPAAEELTLPAAVAAELRSLAEPDLFVPAELDARILAASRDHLGGVRQRGVAARWLIGAAAAAGLLFAAWLGWAPPGAPPAPVARGDLDGDGRVDVLDAFLLARALDGQTALPQRGDVTGDGAVDRRDVDAIARLAVALPPRKGS